MKKTLNLLLISLAIFTISCSSSPDVMDTAIDKQKQLDKAYEEAVNKSETNASSKAKSTESAKAKSDELTGKYSAAMYNGYVDLAGQIAQSKGAQLNQGNGQGGQYVMISIKILFYGVLLMALYMYIRKKLYERRNK